MGHTGYIYYFATTLHLTRAKKTTPPHMATVPVVIGFYEPRDQPETAGWWARAQNWLVSAWTSREGKNFSHVEMRFSDLASTSICREDGAVHLVDGKTMANPNYTTFLSLHVEPHVERAMRRMAQDYHDRGVVFNMGGMLCNFAPLLGRCFSYSGRGPPPSDGGEGAQESVFCSQYVALLLQEAGYVLWLDPERTTPTQLYWALRRGGEGALLDFNQALHAALGKPPLDAERALSACIRQGKATKKGTKRHGFNG